MKSAVAIIPARGGSRRIPRKNIAVFHGLPIIAYSISLALESELFDHVFVSSDDRDIGDIASVFGAKFLLRPAEYAKDEVGTQEVMQYVLSQQMPASRYEYACCIYPTAPMISMRHFLGGFNNLRKDKNAAYSMPVTADDSGGYDPGQWYWGRVKDFVDGYPLVDWGTDKRIWKIIVPPETVCDINTPEDWTRAEKMYAKLHGKS